MSQLETTAPSVALVRDPFGRRSSIPRTTGITESLSAPGVVPEVSRGRSLMNQLQDAQGSMFRLAGTVANIQERNARENAQAAEAEERAAEGLGVRTARTDLPGLLDGISRGGSLGTEEDIRAAVNETLDERTAEMDPAAAAAYRAQAEPMLIGAYFHRQEEVRAKAENDALAALSDRFALAKTPESAASMWAQLKAAKPDNTDSDLFAKVVKPAALAAAQTGDKGRVDAILSVVPADRMTEERVQLDAELAQTAARNQHARNTAFQQDVAGLYNSMEGGGPVTFDVVRDRIAAARGSGVDETVINSAYLALDARRDEAAREANTKVDTVTRESVFQQVKAMATPAFETPGGFLSIPEKVHIPKPDGSGDYTIERDEIVQSVMNDRFAAIDAKYPDNPQMQEAAKVDFLSKQGGQVVYQPWADLMQGAVHFVGRADMSEKEVPPAAIEAVNLHRRLQAMGVQPIINSHIKNEDSRTFLRTVDLAIESNRGISTPQAIVMASRMGDRAFDSHFRRNVSDSVLAKAVKEFDVDNPEEVRAAIATKAEFYKLMGSDDENAVAQVLRDFKTDFTNIDGALAYTAGLNVPNDIDDIAGTLKDWYAHAHGDQGIKRDELKVRIDAETGAVYLAQNGQWRAPETPTLSMEELGQLSTFIRGIDAADTRASGIATAKIERAAEAAKPLTGIISGPLTKHFARNFVRNDPATRPNAEEQAAASSIREEGRRIPADASDDLRAIMEYIVPVKGGVLWAKPGNTKAVPTKVRFAPAPPDADNGLR